MGNETITDENKDGLIARFDVNRDGTVDPAELRRFLSRGMGGGYGVAVEAANYYRDMNRSNSVLFDVFDTDRDGRLSMDECHNASHAIDRLDQDGNGSLSAGEIAPVEMELPDPFRGYRNLAADTAISLAREPEWDELLYTLDSMYSKGVSLSAADFRLTPDLFGRLDSNQDSRIDRDELVAILETPAHLTVRVDFVLKTAATDSTTEDANEPESSAESGSSNFDVRLASDVAESMHAAMSHRDRAEFTLAGDALTIFLVDRRDAADVAAQATRLVAALDRNRNGYLEVEETVGALGFEDLSLFDQDANEQLTAQELEYYFQILADLSGAQIRIQVADHQDALFAYCDKSRDGQLAGREVDQLGARLESLDRNQDGQVDWDELPHALLLAVGRANAITIADLQNTGMARPDEGTPEWFSSMDLNRDGEIGLDEFLGAESQFPRVGPRFRWLRRSGRSRLRLMRVARTLHGVRHPATLIIAM